MSVTSTPHTHVVHHVHSSKSTYYLSPPAITHHHPPPPITTCRHLSPPITYHHHPSPPITTNHYLPPPAITHQLLTCTCLTDPTPCGTHHFDFSSCIFAVHCEYLLLSPSPIIHFNHPVPLQHAVTSLPCPSLPCRSYSKTSCVSMVAWY